MYLWLRSCFYSYLLWFHVRTILKIHTFLGTIIIITYFKITIYENCNVAKFGRGERYLVISRPWAYRCSSVFGCSVLRGRKSRQSGAPASRPNERRVGALSLERCGARECCCTAEGRDFATCLAPLRQAATQGPPDSDSNRRAENRVLKQCCIGENALYFALFY